MYADTTPDGLLQMEKDLTSIDGYTAEEPLLLNLDWVTQQLNDIRFTSPEKAWTILYFLVNTATKVRLTARGDQFAQRVCSNCASSKYCSILTYVLCNTPTDPEMFGCDKFQPKD